MINPVFYEPIKKIKQYMRGKISHFPIRNRTIVLESYAHTISEGETIYTIAAKVFGEDQQHLWTIIADNNHLRPLEDWRPGETIMLPSIILNDPNPRILDYANVPSTASTF